VKEGEAPYFGLLEEGGAEGVRSVVALDDEFVLTEHIVLRIGDRPAEALSAKIGRGDQFNMLILPNPISSCPSPPFINAYVPLDRGNFVVHAAG
jgi:hypothetical protein